ncbi:hypothetical protein ECANGB1_890 [Enterospora canceri]|uniref:Uncharacterized protein n=1 Tax=Enterospora canceri TaxID=1081671 RepID=A0A1Y1S468_9MICR|nr:hypothetical protein ECANGB1_890 [Enterospora canceri]
MLLLDGSAIKICVDELISELNLIIRIRDESHSTRICTVGEKRLLEIGLNDLDEPIEIKIDGWAGHRFKIGLMDVVAENRMDLGLFRQKYSEMDEYAIIGRMDLDDSFYVDEDEFSIRILGDELLGRVFGNKMIIKGRKRVVEAVRSRVA